MNKKIIALSVTASILLNTSIGGYAETCNYNNSLSTNNVRTNVFESIKDSRLINIEKVVNERKIQNELIKKKKEDEENKIKNKKRIDNVQFDSYDLNHISGITKEEMREVLSESHYSNFADIADAFVEAENTYNINAFALVAISAHESGWNTSERAHNGRNNITGMGVPKNASRGTVYKSKYDCIMDLAMQLKNYYLTPGAEYYKGPGTKAINSNYSADPIWYKDVDKIGDELAQIYNLKFKNK